MKALATTQTKQIGMTRCPATVALIYLCAVAVAMVLMAANASGQAAKKSELPKPRPLELKTKDGLRLRAFYFPSNKQKEAIPVILVHEWQGQASPYHPLFIELHKVGCAVLAVEYRGHGGSRVYIDNKGNEQEFNTATMSKADVVNIITKDLEAAKDFLKKENNDGKLNLNALVMVGVREGCVIAANWAARDWSFAPVGALKRGQDVKALVLISPKKLVKGVTIDPVLVNPAILMLPIMVVSGSQSSDAGDADRIIKRIEVFKKRIGRGEAQGLEVQMLKTPLSGPALVREQPKVIEEIKDFITGQVKISDDENPWVARED